MTVGCIAMAAAVTAAPIVRAAEVDQAPDCGNPVASYEPMFALPGPGEAPAGSSMAEIQAHGALVVGVSADTMLFGARNPISGDIEGFDIDVLHEVAEAIFGDPNAIEYKVITYAQRIPSILDGSVDLVAHTMTINCTRWEQIAFSSVYFNAGQRVLVRSDSDVAGIDDLDGLRVCAAEGSTNLDALDAYPGVEQVPVVDLTDCLVLFQQGEVDAITADDTVLEGFAAQDPYAEVVGDAFTEEPYGVGVSLQRPDLVQFVNLVLQRMREDGTWAELYTKWLGGETGEAAPEPPAATYGRQPVL